MTLKDHILGNGFEHGGRRYFRNPMGGDGITRRDFLALEHSGSIQRVGTITHVRFYGVEIPSELQYRSPQSVLHVIDEEVLNDLKSYGEVLNDLRPDPEIMMELEPIQDYDYIIENGFEHKGWRYFRASWMNKRDFERLGGIGLVQRAGTIAYVRSCGVEIPSELQYRSPQSVLHVIDEEVLNALESNQN